jgi:hypothetical protein
MGAGAGGAAKLGYVDLGAKLEGPKMEQKWLDRRWDGFADVDLWAGEAMGQLN